MSPNSMTGKAFKFALLASCIACVPHVAFAQDQSAAAGETAGDAGKTSVTDKSVEAIVVKGRRSLGAGLMKVQSAPEATSSITGAALALKQAAALPLQQINSLPGVNFGTSNPFGLGVRNFMSVRGLDQQQMGWVMEGMPGSDQSQNQPQTQFWADSENVDDLTLIASTTRLHDPVATASGGEVIETVRDPSDHFGGMVAASRGSFSSQRYFGRIDTGSLGNSGITAFGSASYTQGKNFIYPASGNRLHFDAKLVKDWNGNGTSKLYFNYTKFKDVRLNSLTLSQYDTAKAADNFYLGNYSPTYSPGVSNYYKSAIIRYQTWMMSLQNAFALTDKLSLHVTPYYTQRWADGGAMQLLRPNAVYRGNQRVAIDTSQVVLNPNGTFPVQTNGSNRANAIGVNSVLQWDPITTNTLRVGYWFDRYTLSVDNLATIVDASGDSTGRRLNSASGDEVTGQSMKLSQYLHSFNIADTQTFFDERLQLNAGIKLQSTKVDGYNRIPGPPRDFHGSQFVALPRASVMFKPTSDMQVYANITTNTKPPILQTTYSTNYSITTGQVIQLGLSNLKPEYAIGEEIGFRYYGAFNFDLTGFHMYLKNHQISTVVNNAGLLIAQVINVGAESLRGATAEISTKPFHGFSPYANAQYLSTKQENDLPINGTFLPTKGRKMVESPTWVAAAGLNYDKNGLFGSVSVKYVSSQYSTFMNDEKMPGYAVLDASVGYRWTELGGLKEPTVRLNMSNLNKGAYLGTVASLQANAVTTTARNGTSIAGRAASYYLNQPFTIMATLSTKF
jgi:iron complex outermembrane recepter protein